MTEGTILHVYYREPEKGQKLRKREKPECGINAYVGRKRPSPSPWKNWTEETGNRKAITKAINGLEIEKQGEMQWQYGLDSFILVLHGGNLVLSDRCCNENSNKDKVHTCKNSEQGMFPKRRTKFCSIGGVDVGLIAQRRSLMMQQIVRNWFTVVDRDCTCGGQWLSCYVQDWQTKDYHKQIDRLLHGEPEQEKESLSTGHSGFVGLWVPQYLAIWLLTIWLRPVDMTNSEKTITIWVWVMTLVRCSS